MTRTPKRKIVVGIQTPSPSKKRASVDVPHKMTKRKDVQTKNSPSKRGKKKMRRLLLRQEKSDENVHITIADNTKMVRPATLQGTGEFTQNKKEQKRIVVRSQLQLALLSPFRFPIPHERLVSNLARSAGVFFVFVGGLFSLLNLQYATGIFNTLSITANPAQIMDSTTSASISLINTSTSSVYTTPDVRISLPNEDDFTGTVPVMITVAHALEVYLIAVHKSDNHSFSLGRAIKIDEFTWRYYWDTRKFPDGEYRFKVVIKNSHGTYDYGDGESYKVANTPTSLGETSIATVADEESKGESTISNITEFATSATPIAPIVQAVTIRMSESSPIRGDAEIKIFVHDAHEVKVYARNTRTYVLYYIGQAKYQNDDEWRQVWNTLNFPNDTYMLYAKAMVADTLIESTYIQSTIGNEHENLSVTPVTTGDAVLGTDTNELPSDIMVLKPTIETSFSQSNPVSGHVDIFLKTTNVDWVEIYAIPKASLTTRFLGLAQKISSTNWKFTWSTEQSPNGDYDVYVRVKSAYGFTENSPTVVRVRNQIVEAFTKEQEATIDTIIDVGNSLTKVTSLIDTDNETDDIGDSNDTVQSHATVYIEPVDVFVSSIELTDETETTILTLLRDYRKSLDSLQSELAQAIRSDDDEEAIKRIKNSIETIKNDSLQKLSNILEEKEIIDRINGYLSQISFELIELTTNNEKVIRERIGEAVFTDTDKDSVADYDEVNLYHTSPFSADTDGDGYMDNIEITLGYDPLDTKVESSVEYESPRETGVVREDVLTIDSITTLSDDGEGTNSERPVRALISGKALPNSFVTLYIYSTPIVVTVKTDADGNWTYILDKDIEEGNHEVYVGITDNTGRIVAKSSPLPFVKTAEAFTGEGSLVSQIVESNAEPSLIHTNALLLVASIAIIALGLVLILLGFHVQGTKRSQVSEAVPAV